jgi:transposase
VSTGYSHRGRPRKDEKPLMKTEYKVNVELVFNEERAKMPTQDRRVRVLITNLPRTNADAENIRFGATADTVLMAYLGQYRIEHAFRLMKDGIGIYCVYLHRPSRENAMMFVISLATMLSDIVTHVLNNKGIDMTMQSISGTMSRLDIVQDTEGEYLNRSEEHIELFMRILEALKVDPDHLMG